MARKNTAKTPQRPAYEEAEEVSSDEDAGVEGAHNEQIIHLGSDLPDAPAHESDASSEDAETGAEIRTSTAVMAHVLVHQAPAATAGMQHNRPAAKRISTGKLGRPSKDAYVNLKRGEALFTTSALQRRALKGQPRSEFDLPDDSPPKGLAARTKLAQRKPDFSPLKRTRTGRLVSVGQDAIDAQLLAESQSAAAVVPGSDDAEAESEGDSTLLSIKSRRTPRERGPKVVWTEDEDAVLREGAAFDLSAEDIIERYGLKSRTPAAVRGRLKSLRDRAARTGQSSQDDTASEPNRLSVAQGWIQAGQTDGIEKYAEATEAREARMSKRISSNETPKPRQEKSPGAVDEYRGVAKPTAGPLRRSPRKPGNTQSTGGAGASDAMYRDFFRDPEIDPATELSQSHRAIFEKPKPKLKLKESSARLAKTASVPGISTKVDASSVATTAPVTLRPQDVTFPEQRQASRANAVRPSGQVDGDDEFHSASEGEAPDRGDDDAEVPGRSQSTNASNTSRKRQAPAGPSRKTKKQRPLRTVDDDDDEAELQERTLDTTTPQRLFGQWVQFKKTVYAARKVLRRKSQIEYQEFVSFRKTCKKLIGDLRASSDAAQSSEAVPLDERLVALTAQARTLYTDDQVERSERADWGLDIHACLIPHVVNVIEAIVEHYERPLPDKPALAIRTDDTANIINLMDIIEDAPRAARKNYPADPKSQYPIRQEVTASIVVPLRHIRNELSKNHTALIAAHNTARLAARERADEAAFRATQQRIEAQEAHSKVLRAKWNMLHFERKRAEGLIFERAKRDHLALPCNMPEDDSAGYPMQREPVFHARVGPTPTMTDAAKMLVWSMPQLVALQEGLKKYAGERVLESVMLAHCRPGGVLNEFNVTEIVVQAAMIREQLLEGPQRDEEWVRGIPDLGVWSRGSGGAENQDPSAVVGESTTEPNVDSGAETGPSRVAGSQAEEPLFVSDDQEEDDDDDDDEEEA